MKNPSECLEWALRVWESICFSTSVAATLLKNKAPGGATLPNEGPIKYGHLFRKFLLSRTPEFDADRFFGPHEVAERIGIAGPFYAFLPMELHNWSQTSRRVYAVTEELQKFLEITSLKGVRWNDITWPFPSFALTLPIPVLDDKKREFRCVLVSQPQDFQDNQGKKGLIIRIFESTFDQVPWVTPKKRFAILKLLQERRWNKAHRRLDEYLDEAERKRDAGFTNILFVWEHQLSGEEVLTSFRRPTTLHRDGGKPTEEIPLPEVFESILRLVIGLCLYLQMAPNKQCARSSWTPHPKPEIPPTFDPTTIVDEAEVCEVKTVRNLSHLEEEIFRKVRVDGVRSLKQLPVHYREAHWRRPPGKGDDPNHPKTVHVHWTIVNLERLPEEGLPKGSEHQH